MEHSWQDSANLSLKWTCRRTRSRQTRVHQGSESGSITRWSHRPARLLKWITQLVSALYMATDYPWWFQEAEWDRLATFLYRMSLTTCHSLTLNYLGENPLFRLLRFSRISSTPHPIPRLCKFSADYADSKSSINHTCPIQHIVCTRIWIGFVVDLSPFYALLRCVPLCSGTFVGERDH